MVSKVCKEKENVKTACHSWQVNTLAMTRKVVETHLQTTKDN
uniref:Uncharacterized protein n=1 Tax=Arundo donax TaxID=35708 RepID=A0A0A9CG06_ARUDO